MEHPIPSESSTLVDDVDDCLNLISPYFRVSETKYGGRGCFSYTKIPKNTIILTCTNPVSSTILRPFKKEVCHNCFQYFDGKTLRVKLGSSKIAGQSFSLYFCSEKCRDIFEEEDPNNLYLDSLMNIEKHYINGLKKPEEEPREPKGDVVKVIEEEWDKVRNWEIQINRMKATKRINLVPRISESEYLEVKYVIGVLLQFYKYKNQETTHKFLNELNDDECIRFELDIFNILQSSEQNKVMKYPYLLYSYINIYTFIKLTSNELLQPFISTTLIRSIIGKNLSNAFGIWSIQTANEDKEFFGFGVYPSASFFNHSCAPNLIKKRIGNSLTFTALRDIEPNQELCIDYGNYLNEDVKVRMRELTEWFFNCGCEKCCKELSK